MQADRAQNNLIGGPQQPEVLAAWADAKENLEVAEQDVRRTAGERELAVVAAAGWFVERAEAAREANAAAANQGSVGKSSAPQAE